MAYKYCQPKAPILFHYQPCAPASASFSTPNTTTFPDLFHHLFSYKQPRDSKGTKDKILIYLGNHGLYLILFWCAHFTPTGHFYTKYLLSNKVTFLLLFSEKLHTHCLCVGRGRRLPYCSVKPLLHICIKIHHQSQEAFLFYIPLIFVITRQH